MPLHDNVKVNSPTVYLTVVYCVPWMVLSIYYNVHTYNDSWKTGELPKDNNAAWLCTISWGSGHHSCVNIFQIIKVFFTIISSSKCEMEVWFIERNDHNLAYPLGLENVWKIWTLRGSTKNNRRGKGCKLRNLIQ